MSSRVDTGARLIEQVVQLAVIALFVVWCFQIARPFLVPAVWGLIIAVALFPAFRKLRSALGERPGLAATLFTLAALAMVMAPTYFIANSLVDTSVEISRRLEAGERPEIPPPSEGVKEWPLIGTSLHEAWSLAAQDTETALHRYERQLRVLAGGVLKGISGVGAAVVQSIFAIILAGLFLATAQGGGRTAQAIGARLGGEMGRKAVLDAGATITSVAKGVLGVALVQGLAAAIALFFVKVPAAGLWTLGVMILAVIQLPPILLLGPICVWVFGNVDNTTVAVLFTIWSLVVSGADGFLKPIFLGRGVEIPMPVILIGAIGGMISMGIIGLFLGAVVLSIGYSLFGVWLHPQPDSAPGDAAPAPAPEAAP